MSVRRAIVEADVSTLNVAAFCRSHGISRDRFYAIRRRWEAEGDAALEPRSRAPRRVANRTDAAIEEAIVRQRKALSELGVDAGAATIAFHLAQLRPPLAVPSESTIYRVLKRHGFIVADPSKVPKRAVRSFCAERVNECWQIDDTGWQLADGTAVKIINVLDDCCRVCVDSRAVAGCTGAEAFAAIAGGADVWGWPEWVLSDNAKAFRYPLAAALEVLGVAMGHSRPYHPQTCGKVERFHQTLKKFLAAQPAAATIAELQAQLDRFVAYYNHHRPHRGIGRKIPAQYRAITPKTGPAPRPVTATSTVTTHTVTNGSFDIGGKLRIAIGAKYTGQQATTIITADHAHVFVDGRLVRELTIDPTRRRQSLRPRKPPASTNP